MNPKISIVIASYNREDYLPKAIESVLLQTYENFELIIWDDGSTDGSLAIAQEYAQYDPRISVMVSPRPRQGHGAVLNQAFAHTSGEYIGWVDSDDALAPEALARTAEILDRSPDIGWVYTNYVEMDETDNVLGLGGRCQVPYDRDRLLVDFMTFHFRLMRRSVFDAVGGLDASFRTASDYDLCLKLSEEAAVYHVNQPLYYYRIHTNSLSQRYRMRQIQESGKAIAQALERRGLGDRYAVDVKIIGQFTLRPK
jgi:glycosyltransferase involved in cell wall biosynthesis